MSDIDVRLAEWQRATDKMIEDWGCVGYNRKRHFCELARTAMPKLLRIARAADELVQSDRIILCRESDKLRKALYAD